MSRFRRKRTNINVCLNYFLFRRKKIKTSKLEMLPTYRKETSKSCVMHSEQNQPNKSRVEVELPLCLAFVFSVCTYCICMYLFV